MNRDLPGGVGLRREVVHIYMTNEGSGQAAFPYRGSDRLAPGGFRVSRVGAGREALYRLVGHVKSADTTPQPIHPAMFDLIRGHPLEDVRFLRAPS